jgi:hypothetical protein
VVEGGNNGKYLESVTGLRGSQISPHEDVKTLLNVCSGLVSICSGCTQDAHLWLRLAHPQLRLKHQLLRPRDGNGKWHENIPVSNYMFYKLWISASEIKVEDHLSN